MGTDNENDFHFVFRDLACFVVMLSFIAAEFSSQRKVKTIKSILSQLYFRKSTTHLIFHAIFLRKGNNYFLKLN